VATKINAGGTEKRGDLWFVDPYQVQVSEELRGRRRPPADDAIIEMACSLLEHGQLQPVLTRRDGQGRLVLTLGFTRTAAARLIRDGFTDPDGTERRDERFMLKAAVSDCSDQQAFTRNVIENARRNATSDMDDAHNQERLRGYGMTDVEIGRLYGARDGARVSRIRKLLRLNDDAQLLVHQGQLSVDAALTMLDMPEPARKAAVEKAKSGEKVTGADVKRQVREHHLRDEPSDGATPEPMAPSGKAPKTPLSIREIRKFFEDLAVATDSVDDPAWIPAVQRFAKDFGAFLAGTKSEKAARKAISRMLATTPETGPAEAE
jgi:ParB-like chromosome segregation protein Spo0J